MPLASVSTAAIIAAIVVFIAIVWTVRFAARASKHGVKEAAKHEDLKFHGRGGRTPGL
jgi:TRAP-type uncharacterized transport system fused permease subunit